MRPGQTLAREVAAYCYFLSKLLDYFSDDLMEDELRRAQKSGDLEILARARQSMETNVNITVLLVNEFTRRISAARAGGGSPIVA